MTFAVRSYVSDEYGMSDEEAGNLYAAYGFACTGVDVSCNEETNRVGNNSNANKPKILEILENDQDDTRQADFQRGQDTIMGKG